MNYLVGITIHNTFEVEADSEQEAENIVTDMTNDEILVDCDIEYTYVDEVHE